MANMQKRKRSGSHCSATFGIDWIQDHEKPSTTATHRHEGPDPLMEGVDHVLDGRELDPALAPHGRAGRDAALVQAARRILDEAHLQTPIEEPSDRRVVAAVAGD